MTAFSLQTYIISFYPTAATRDEEYNTANASITTDTEFLSFLFD